LNGYIQRSSVGAGKTALITSARAPVVAAAMVAETRIARATVFTVFMAVQGTEYYGC
jgi:hypothetical protein